ncbi:hypothetical protein C1G86_1059 [Dehalococcoides mccartyi]|uniref:Uncharacterized protein n=2 Tax=Dehalococcoides mccartyi TaxID=61435 RepID=A0A328ET16_9CHLR|nr:hypothetical protein [Dehalococcoides mccartyi]RAL69308.1 hypothetical protein C1G87_1031 [Dehalococcoides mccartyi]RAL70489.1 hypothetical protein C1G86_1059 [Dehalococcoides mccartyi]CAI83189.1 hypothetical protein cbdbA1089 [Dehalococcoides mccartyi CBDB1]
MGLYFSKLIITFDGRNIRVDATNHPGETVKFTLPIISE